MNDSTLHHDHDHHEFSEIQNAIDPIYTDLFELKFGETPDRLNKCKNLLTFISEKNKLVLLIFGEKGKLNTELEELSKYKYCELSYLDQNGVVTDTFRGYVQFEDYVIHGNYTTRDVMNFQVTFSVQFMTVKEQTTAMINS